MSGRFWAIIYGVVGVYYLASGVDIALHGIGNRPWHWVGAVSWLAGAATLRAGLAEWDRSRPQGHPTADRRRA